MATYTITATGSGLKITDSTGRGRNFPIPEMNYIPLAVYPLTVPVLEIRSRTYLLQITADDTVTVAGDPGANTLPALYDQIAAILPGDTSSLEFATIIEVDDFIGEGTAESPLGIDPSIWDTRATGFTPLVSTPFPTLVALTSSVNIYTANGGAASGANSGDSAIPIINGVVASTGSQTNGIAGMVNGSYSTSGQHRFGIMRTVIQGRCALSTLPNGTNNFTMYLGATNSLSSPPTSFIGFRVSLSLDGTNVLYQAVTKFGASETLTAVSVTATAFFDWKVVVAADRSSIEYYINGILIATHTTSITNANNLALVAQIQKNSGTTPVTLTNTIWWPHLTA